MASVPSAHARCWSLISAPSRYGGSGALASAASGHGSLASPASGQPIFGSLASAASGQPTCSSLASVASGHGWCSNGGSVYELSGGAGTSIYKAPEVDDFFASSEERGRGGSDNGGGGRGGAAQTLAVYNEKVDIFALGVIMYELFSRHCLLRQRSQHELCNMRNHMRGGRRPRRPAAVTDDRVWSLIERCWADDPAQRPCAREVVQELEAILQELPKQQQHHHHHHHLQQQQQQRQQRHRRSGGGSSSIGHSGEHAVPDL